MKASVLVHQEQVLLDGKYVMTVVVYSVEKSKKFPDGIKAKFLLQDAEEGSAKLLIDNHQPYGFHMHTRMPRSKDWWRNYSRKDLSVTHRCSR